MNDLLSKALTLQKQYKFIAPKDWGAEEKENLMNDFTFHSNKLEGLKLEYGDTIEYLKNGVIRKNADIKDITDLENHRNLLKKVFDTYEQMTLSANLIKDLHAEMMKDKIQWSKTDAYMGGPGKFKRENNYGTRKHGEYKEYMDWMDVPKALDQLCAETNERLRKPAEVIPAINTFHYEFANNIHPFGDGNGRVVRLLHNILLLKNRLPVIVIKGDEKNEYLENIIKQEKNPEAKAFDEFLTKKVIDEMEKRLKRSRGMSI